MENKTISTQRLITRSTALAVLFVLLVCISLSGYLYQQLCALKQTLRTQSQSDEENQAHLQSTLNVLRATTGQTHQRVNTLDRMLRATIHEQQYQTEDWLSLKAQYYLELATINLHWDNARTTSLILFQQADTLLSKMHDPWVLPVRQSIADNIATLNAIQEPDTAGILSTLDALQRRIETLPIKHRIQGLKSIPPTQATAPAWKTQLQDTLNQLAKLVVIQHHDQNILNELTPAYAVLLRENIRLNLQEAQWAVIQKNQSVYTLTINQIKATLQRAFDANSADGNAIIQTLEKLLNTPIEITIPPLDHPLKLINQHLDAQLKPDTQASLSIVP